MKFVRKDTPTIQDGLVVRYKLSSGLPGDGEISASRDGVCVGGYFPTMTEKAATDFLGTFYRALVQYQSIRDTSKARNEEDILGPYINNNKRTDVTTNPLDHPLLKA